MRDVTPYSHAETYERPGKKKAALVFRVGFINFSFLPYGSSPGDFPTKFYKQLLSFPSELHPSFFILVPIWTEEG